MSKAEFRFSPRPNRAAEIDWQGWGETAFARARRENKPVLLAISAVWCHWCHVMDETSYSDLDVIALINDRYLPIRVDADRQPEVNARYNMGGWPTTAVLTPDGDTITGATYIAPAQMREFLRDISEFFHSQRSLLDAKLAETRARSANLPTERGTLTVAIIDSVISTIGEAYDEEYGGFGGEPKFPQTDLLEFLLRELRLRRATGNDDGGLYEMLAKTALAMGRSGMYDHIEGGFFRYSTTRDWTIPHFEKMTEDHGGLLRVYAGLYRISHNGAFRETLHSATRYVRTVLRDARTGLFAGSQDADESYFTSSLEDRMTRDAPDVDRTSYVNWTANVCCGLLAAADALGDDDLGAYAVTAIDAMVDAAMLDADGLVRHYIATDGSAHGRGLLDDQAWLLRAFVEAHAYDGEPRHRERALALADAILAAFVAADGGIVDNAYGAAGLGRVSIPSRPIREIAHLADTLLVLAALADNARYADAAHGALEMFVPVYRRSGTFAAPFAAAARRALAPPTIVTLVGAPADTIAFRADARMLPDPFTVVRTFTPDDPRLATAGLPPHAPRAYVCVGTTCSAPVDDPAAIRDAYLRLIDSLRSITLELDTKASQSESS